ncbi:MAG: aminodeoxychorismate/anthranilate synthase component II [Spirochaetia bacterium]|nr:aminodeoxychorismate/anthranilate synthase component II [Spirochaetia bacterium]
MKLLLIDNYDSFTYNLYQIAAELLEQAGGKLDVIRNDELTFSEIESRQYDRIIVSPGPGSPDDPAYFGVCSDVLTKSTNVPVLGVCLGMQGLAYCFGGKVVRARLPMHGKVSSILHDGRGVFRDLPQSLSAMRYHSLVVEPESLPDCFEISARAQLDGSEPEIMGIRHKSLPLEGIQFHPESFATEGGTRMIQNFLNQ